MWEIVAIFQAQNILNTWYAALHFMVPWIIALIYHKGEVEWFGAWCEQVRACKLEEAPVGWGVKLVDRRQGPAVETQSKDLLEARNMSVGQTDVFYVPILAWTYCHGMIMAGALKQQMQQMWHWQWCGATDRFEY